MAADFYPFTIWYLIMKKNILPNLIQTEDSRNLHGISVENHDIVSYSPHRHAFYEFDYIVKGEAEVSLNGIVHKIKAGSMIFSSPVDIHSYKSLNGEPISFITLHFTDLNLPENLSLSDRQACVLSCDEELKSTFFLLKKEFDSDYDGYTYKLLKNLLERTVILFLRRTKSFQEKPVPEEISYAISYIIKNFRSNISLIKISSLCGYSQSYFCRRFKEYLGMTFNDYLTKIRLSHAKNILLSQKISVTELCYECGFTSTRNFSRAFSKEFGCSPSEFTKKTKTVL